MKHPLVLADRARVRQFAALGRLRRLFAPGRRTDLTDAGGGRWAVTRVGVDAFAVPALGPGWVFDPTLAGLRAGDVTRLRDRARAAPGGALREAVGALRLGGRCERALWSLHRHLVAARRSVFRIPDAALGADVFGPDRCRWPAHWRTDLLAVLAGLARLHAGECDGGAAPSFGAATALLNAAVDLRGGAADACGADCPGHGRGPHSHYQVNAGRGLTGVLERLAAPPDPYGTRSYDFDPGDAMREAGRTGRLTRAFLPARLGAPDAREALSHGQHDILQALVGELTRARRGRGARGPARPELVTGGRVRIAAGPGAVVCPLLDPARQYCGFNGSGARRGRGYRMATPGGWLAKAGYAPARLEAFVADLAALAPVLGLVVAALDPLEAPGWADAERLAALARTAPGRAVLRRLHLRVYAEEGWERRWDRTFRGPADGPAPGPGPELGVRLAGLNVTRRRLAGALGADPSFLSKVLNGKKPWPADLAARARAYLDREEHAPPGTPADALADLWSGAGVPDPEPRPFGEVAARLAARGWSVVPVPPGEKKPCIRWGPYREGRATAGELAAWAVRWPDAGAAVALGPVSGLFVIDVDGPEAHAALVGRLGAVPAAPLAVSGSRAPFRYHLYFRHPPVGTAAKATPWHPKLEFRGNGGLVVAPPSPHRSGRRYAWAPGRSPDEVAPPEVPPPVLAAVVRPTRAPVDRVAPAVAPALAPPPGVSDSTRDFLAGTWAEGPGWNDRLFRAACDLSARGVPEPEAAPLLLAGARPWGDPEAALARATIASAYSRPRRPSEH